MEAVNRVRLAILAVALILMGGCSSPQKIELQNDGPGPVTVVVTRAEANPLGLEPNSRVWLRAV